jgi:hypothetical protein
VIDKKKEEKPITSWVVNETEIKNIFRKDFDATKHETEFESITDSKINEELKEVKLFLVSVPRRKRQRKNLRSRKSVVSSSPRWSRTRSRSTTVLSSRSLLKLGRSVCQSLTSPSIRLSS